MKPRLTSTSCITEDIAALQYAGQIVDNSGCVNEKKLNDRHQEENNFNQNGDCDTSNSIQLYKHLQRCNSTQNHFEEVKKSVKNIRQASWIIIISSFLGYDKYF